MTADKNGESVTIRVACNEETGELVHIWNSIGFDEINWSYTPRGQALLATLNREIVEQAYYVRNHNTFTSGNCLSYPAGGSTNIYREDENGQPVYNWETVDKIYDAYVGNGFRPLIELGFLPFDLVPENQAVAATFNPAFDVGFEPYESGKWKLPPKDFTRWEKLVEAFLAHVVERYGADEVANWYFELWNEPDITHYWRGTVEDYCRLYDHSVVGATRAFPQVKIGGPATTDKGVEFLRTFLEHCTHGRNFVTGETGTQLDFISFHTKGAYYTPRRSYGHPVNHETPSLSKMLNDIRRSLKVIAQFPELHRLPVFVDECDPAVGTIYGVYDTPNFIVCNNEYYPSFVAAMVGQILQLNRKMAVPVRMITHWAFYFEGKRFFEGNRTLVTNQNIWNPIMAGLKMLGKLGRRQLNLQSSAALDVLSEGYNNQIHLVDGLATLNEDGSGEKKLSVLLWHHCDDWAADGEQAVNLQLVDLPFAAGQTLTVKHWRVDGEHSNAYTEWLRLGRPEGPDADQLEKLQTAQQLALLQEPTTSTLDQSGVLTLSFNLPAHAVSLIELTVAKDGAD
jgi:xylan 1,4-beta-xylosidase